MEGKPILRFTPAAAILVATLLAGCAQTQLELSQRETDAILTDLQGQVARERDAAKKASDAKPIAKEPEQPIPAVLDLNGALKIAGRQNRDLLRSREGLALSAVALVNARNDVGPRLAGSVSSILRGDDRAEEVRTNAGTLSVSQLLPTGASASVIGDLSQTHGRGDAVP